MSNIIIYSYSVWFVGFGGDGFFVGSLVGWSGFFFNMTFAVAHTMLLQCPPNTNLIIFITFLTIKEDAIYESFKLQVCTHTMLDLATLKLIFAVLLRLPEA